MTINLPAVPFMPAYPQLMESVSVSRSGTRAMSFVEYADAYWTIQMKTVPLKPAQRLVVEAFKDACRGGLTTITYTPQHMCVPQAYWGDSGNAALSNSGNLVSITGNSLVINSVDNGLTLGPGDLISATTGSYNSLFRVQTGATAAANTMTITVEPTVPAYITAGAVITFKNPIANMRVMPGSFSIGDDFFSSASFTLVEIPK
ncbi:MULTISPECIES: hypothetical protein [unclassified Mesorhizobium]|uniref:hypothetical protein n=1 Tax=unclassified Mesorhizobium TaxID=325217 RepID=UPI000FDC1DCC|nr:MULTISPECIES: hypothetical protein [unclassified Mesorhizobium]TGU41638.1 hypothetical protein EN799_03525 [bacterium M00.F.Ca.ET.156.01.1.1]TGV89738.1 hypothetical protein EN792_006160 [Mesorhizobium sp. M00.F.Ca.ET.149.01.1.1]TGR32996.1 hypothetical protein EN840_01290 [Mesorhizobium sp. M8A.F.Ca.ET.197.01.1.1]TGR34642.1 hypothetical protein EN845_01290 [Mesorhizobium sp. M8A.F.Ca.ET.202.01.1.1]TGR59185.1 hypothetical protein EN841_01290 [Mesorhizobium sp. M8A.F.Ca.ET.198.01.1.1]